MMQLIQDGVIDGIICWHPDRLARNETDAATIVRLIRHRKLKDIRFASYTFQNSPEGIMMLQIALSQSQYYSSKLSTDVWRGMSAKIDRGWWSWRAPEGWKNDAESRHILPDPKRFHLIERFVRLVLNGTHNVPQALTVLNEHWHYRTKAGAVMGGGPLSESSAYDLLGNPFLAGYFVVKDKLYRGLHKPMLTYPEFEALQLRLGRQSRRNRKREFAYTGLIQCRRCGSMVTAGMHKQQSLGGPYTYYYCSNKDGRCTRQGIRQEELERQFVEVLSRVTIDREVGELIHRQLAEWRGGLTEQLDKLHRTQQRSLKEVEKHQQALLDLRLKGLITDETFATKQRSLESDALGLRDATERRQEATDEVYQSSLNATDFLLRAKTVFEEGGLIERREIVQALASNYQLDGKELRFDLHACLTALQDLNEDQDPSGSNARIELKAKPERFRSGGPCRVRTGHLFTASEALCQMS